MSRKIEDARVNAIDTSKAKEVPVVNERMSFAAVDDDVPEVIDKNANKAVMHLCRC